jgi:hypothetical protein
MIFRELDWGDAIWTQRETVERPTRLLNSLSAKCTGPLNQYTNHVLHVPCFSLTLISAGQGVQKRRVLSLDHIDETFERQAEGRVA